MYANNTVKRYTFKKLSYDFHLRIVHLIAHAKRFHCIYS